MKTDLGTLAGRLLLGSIFLAAGVLKVVHPADFFSDLLAYDVPFPEMMLRVVAVVLPWLEGLCGLCLFSNLWPESVRPLSVCLCLIFVGMLGQAVGRGLDLNCGCFGAAASGWFARPAVALMRAIILLAISLYLARSAARDAAKTPLVFEN